MSENPPRDQRWQIDRHVPLALIVTIALSVLAQTVAGTWWASRTDSRIEHLEALARNTPNPSERIVRVEVKLESITERLSEIKQLLTKH